MIIIFNVYYKFTMGKAPTLRVTFYRQVLMTESTLRMIMNIFTPAKTLIGWCNEINVI